MRKGSLLAKALIGLVVLVPLIYFGLFLSTNVVGGASTDQSVARTTASDLALILSDFELAWYSSYTEFRAEIPTDFWLNVSLEERRVQVFKGDTLDETYSFSKPTAKRICCPRKRDREERACSTFCPDSLALGLNKEVGEDMKVTKSGDTIEVSPIY
jgi:hypothetical protein